MPFIRGRYHINPIAGAALEAAREAEEALAVLKSGNAGEGPQDENYERDREAQGDDKGPIHRVEIETASLVPAHSGEAAHGFVARVHRASYLPVRTASDPLSPGVPQPLLQKPETHVFASHNDLVDFLRRELAKGSEKGERNRGNQRA